MSTELDRLLEAGESETCEFKGPQASLDALATAVCGMLNQQGGVVLWGVTDDRRAVGVADADQRAGQLNDYLARHLRPRPLVSVSVDGEHPIIVVDVPKGADKPYALGGAIFIRLRTHTMRATAAKNAELVEQSAAQLERWERELMPAFTLPECDGDELGRTHAEIDKSGRFGSVLPDSPEDLLRALNLMRAGQFTNACVVLFARQPRAWAPNLALRVTSYSEPHKGTIGLDTLLEGPAVEILRRAIALIEQLTGVSSRFDRDQLARSDRPAYGRFALREGLVNALVHRDYSGLGDVRVEIHPDSLVIHNPGRLPEGWTIKHLRTEHVSMPVNPDVARVFFLRGLMEQLGMGTQRLIAECRTLGAKTPIWSADRGTVSLRMFRAPAQAMLIQRQADFVERARPGQAFALREYARAAKVSERQARRDLQDLLRAGLIDRRGRGPATSYELRPDPGKPVRRARGRLPVHRRRPQ